MTALEKQQFLKAIYEDFYKIYNPKAADRLGVVYTPNEIVEFMIRATDELVHRHFGRHLYDEKVQILDPAAGTGTFITDLIEFMPQRHLAYKYANEIHANEVSILPYYIANLNIEYTYKQKTGEYKEFPNICFVDTLENMDFEGRGGQMDLLGSLSHENMDRVIRQNEKNISVVIGNPPYNANQRNENDNNKNRKYPEIDARIKETYIEQSTARKTKQYDMYKRFIRWASDRLDKDGVLAFVSNNAFIDARQDDGFRKVITNSGKFGCLISKGTPVPVEREESGRVEVYLKTKFELALQFTFSLRREGRMVVMSIMMLYLITFVTTKKSLTLRAGHWIKINSPISSPTKITIGSTKQTTILTSSSALPTNRPSVPGQNVQ